MHRTELRMPEWMHEALRQEAHVNKSSINQTATQMIRDAILRAKVDDYIAEAEYGQVAWYCVIRSGDRYAFVWSGGQFPVDDWVPEINLETQEAGIKWFGTLEAALAEANTVLEALDDETVFLKIMPPIE